MQFGFLNLTGFLIVALMMIPNLIYARRNPHIENKCCIRRYICCWAYLYHLV